MLCSKRRYTSLEPDNTATSDVVSNGKTIDAASSDVLKLGLKHFIGMLTCDVPMLRCILRVNKYVEVISIQSCFVGVHACVCKACVRVAAVEASMCQSSRARIIPWHH